MTFAQLQQHLQRQSSLDQCAAFLSEHAQALRDLFYGSVPDPVMDAPREATAKEIEAEQALIDLLNSRCGDDLRNGVQLPDQVEALLIYFISLCERAGFYQRLLQISRILPHGALRHRAEAVYQYKHIDRASTDYIARFERIATSLQAAWSETPESERPQCEDMLVEYFCSATAPRRGIGERNRADLQALLADRRHQARYPILRSARLQAILSFADARLAEERTDTNARIAEAFYDEAALLLPVPPPPPEPTVCLATGKSHAGHCPPGLHAARAEIRAMYPTQYANTGTFIKQPLTPAAYTEFNDITKCMRYFRQYMPLHMPQVDKAICETLDRDLLPRKRVNVVDIGGGPGTLYTVLASVLRRNPYKELQFDVTLVEPSRAFHEFLTIIAKHVTHPNLTIREMCACTSDQLPTVITKKSADWYFIANAITPIVKAAGGDAVRAVTALIDVVKATRRKRAPCILTLAENTQSADFPSVFAAFRTHGLQCQARQCICDGAWLKDCYYRVAYSAAQIPAPRLKYACVEIPEGALP